MTTGIRLSMSYPRVVNFTRNRSQGIEPCSLRTSLRHIAGIEPALWCGLRELHTRRRRFTAMNCLLHNPAPASVIGGWGRLSGCQKGGAYEPPCGRRDLNPHLVSVIAITPRPHNGLCRVSSRTYWITTPAALAKGQPMQRFCLPSMLIFIDAA